ncbi:hypothetical protein Cri9333_1608 [Crinalium epipsammum PCC 9333]|uniref:Uncharacterized protein n=1 Tax=Crinalium epipsammum PCC 9333 TaxID=1173022 RepID=K9VWL5_9CYAN|nr:hypothetical protein [Crinalium epipsammum]AFZ12498.1 hypothetical protein Cri9333_1608 [Crinalium epipsammum PCC 9333]
MKTLQKLRIGELLVYKKVLHPTELEKLLTLQSSCGKKLGEIVVENKLVCESDLELILQEQHWRNNGFWVID